MDVAQPEADAGEVLEAEEELSRLAQAILAMVEVEAELEVEAEEVVLPAEVVVVEGLGDWSHIGVHVGSPIVVSWSWLGLYHFRVRDRSSVVRRLQTGSCYLT